MGQRAESLPDGHPAWALEARYLALALNNFVCTLSPRRIILGGGVMSNGLLFPLLRQQVLELLNHYVRPAPHLVDDIDRYIVPPWQGRTEEAIELFEKAIAIKPGLFDALYHLGATRWWTKDYEGAFAPLKAAVGLNPRHPEARYYLGLTLRQRGDRRARELERAAVDGPTLAPIHLHLGVARQTSGDLDGAIASFRRATHHHAAG